MSNRTIHLGLIILAGLLIITAPVTAREPVMGWYYPLNLGASWTYQNVDDPFDTYTESVFDVFQYEGQPAYKMGRALDDYVVVHSFMGVVTVFAVVLPGKILDLDENLVLEDVTDGGTFEDCFESPCETVLIRTWDTLDPALRSIYGMDPGLTDMLLFAAYDPSYPPNLHNVVVESNLPEGVTPPVGAVTDLDWYLRGIGLVMQMDVDAPSGGVEEQYELIEVSPVSYSPNTALRLHQNQPNPFNPATTIAFELAKAGTVDLSVFDARGHLVRTLLADEILPAGPGQAVWRGRDDAGLPVAAGVYFSVLVTEDGRQTRPMTLLK